MVSEESDKTNSPQGLESKPIVIAQSAETINNQNIGMLITAKIDKDWKRSEKVRNTSNKYTIVWEMHR
jgi:hypothetical protein